MVALGSWIRGWGMNRQVHGFYIVMPVLDTLPIQ